MKKRIVLIICLLSLLLVGGCGKEESKDDDNEITTFADVEYYKEENQERYEEYALKNEDLSYADVVMFVNLFLDYDPYSMTKEVENPDDYLVLVNKYHYLPEGYKPDDLVEIAGYYEGQKVYVRKVAADAWEDLNQKAKEDGFTLVPTTAFRSSSFQNTLYTNYVNRDGKAAADTYSARPGFSEHQTGLAIDLKNPSLQNIRLDEEDYTWLKQHCADYGFIVRFPGGKEHITLYQEENWHIRYVGVDAAKIIMKNNLTLEEYLELY